MQALWDELGGDGVGFAKRGRETRRSVDNLELAALEGNALARRFRYWRGASGRRYLFSVYNPASCPAYEDVVLIVAAVAESGERRILSIIDTGALPELAVARAREIATSPDMRVEHHVHLLAGSRAERAATIDDLRPGLMTPAVRSRA
jgi:hypothetical protein